MPIKDGEHSDLASGVPPEHKLEDYMKNVFSSFNRIKCLKHILVRISSKSV
jgi:hypothetical protein